MVAQPILTYLIVAWYLSLALYTLYTPLNPVFRLCLVFVSLKLMLPPSSKIVQPQATLAELTQYQVMQLYSLMSSILLDDQRRNA